MTQYAHSEAFNNFEVAYKAQVRAAFLKRIQVIEGGLEKVVNTAIDRMFAELYLESGGRFIGSPEQQALWGVSWEPLTAKYEKTKNQSNGFFVNTGQLITAMVTQRNRQGVSMSSLVGGFNPKSVDAKIASERYSYTDLVKQSIIDLKSGEIVDGTKVTQVLTFNVMEKLQKDPRPELLFDVGASSSLSSKGTGQRVLNSMKLGLFYGHYPSWYRPFIKPYAAWYAKTVIPMKVKAYLRNPKKYSQELPL